MDQVIKCPTKDFESYMEYISSYCEEKGFSLILKGSLANGTAEKNSDIDLIVLGQITNTLLNNMISGYDTPVMTNLTEKPKGILIIVYPNGICVDLDIRNSVTPEDLADAIVLFKHESNFVISNTVSRQRDILFKFLPDRPDWYKVLRLLHRGLIKYLCGKTDSAYELLGEIIISLDSIKIRGVNTSGDLKNDMVESFQCIDRKYDVGCKIRNLFEDLFNQL